MNTLIKQIPRTREPQDEEVLSFNHPTCQILVQFPNLKYTSAKLYFPSAENNHSDRHFPVSSLRQVPREKMQCSKEKYYDNHNWVQVEVSSAIPVAQVRQFSLLRITPTPIAITPSHPQKVGGRSFVRFSAK